MLNREVFVNDPATNVIPNLGVAKVVDPETHEEWSVLRWELEHFVCDGEYGRGLDRVLSTYLGYLNQPEQPAVWVSGFYGSGKSHFVRVLEYIWRDVKFEDGASARGLAKLPEDIKAQLTELSTAGKRRGGLWSAAGTLNASAGTSVRLATLAVLLRSAGLPEQYPLARLVIWLKQEGYYEAVKAAIEAKDRSLAHELRNLYVSPVLGKVLFDTIPEFVAKPAEVGSLLKAQYPPVSDISNDDLVQTMEDVLELRSTAPGKLPCTLLVLDELQQFIGQDNERANHVQEVVQACSARFGSLILFVATGQAALQATPQLSKLQGRFTARVTLSDSDVEQVTREVVLRKIPDKVPTLKAVLERVSGEIDRHLAGTRIGSTASDTADLVADYPLLPSRRRFWERVLRSVDVSGTAGQLRTQLQIVHEATKDVADKPLGWVVAGDVIYDQLKASMLQSGVLLREIAQIIDEQDDGTPEGRFSARLCATAYLIGKLPTNGPAAAGLRPTADTLCDLLVEDLPAGSAALRQRVPELLTKLAESGILMQVDGEYRLQTRESAQWENDYRLRYNGILNDDARIAGDRATELRTAVSTALNGITLSQGTSKTPRKISQHFGPDTPQVGVAVPVWVRDEWSVSQRAVRQDAQAAGVESPIVLVFLPKRGDEALRRCLAARAAAEETIHAKGTQTVPEGIEAQKAMESRLQSENNELASFVSKVLKDARVYQGGGNEVADKSLVDSVRLAANSALTRLFPKFAAVDHPSWGNVVKQASDGGADALSKVGYTGDADKHPACQEVRQFIGSAGKKGSEVRKHFQGGQYGWPQDAVDGALLVLVAGGFARAARNGQHVTPKDIPQSQIGTTDFLSEGTVVSASQRLAIRKLGTDLGLSSCKSGEEASCVVLMLQQLSALADAAGGEPPLPACPDKTALKTLQALAGNEQLVAVYNQRVDLLGWYQLWAKVKTKIAEREPAWERLERLLAYADGLPAASEVRPQVQAIKAQRTLLAEPSPIAPLSDKLAAALRAAAQEARKHAAAVYDREMETLQASSEWQGISAETRQRIAAASGLGAIATLEVGTDDALLASLAATSLADWWSLAEVLPTRAAKAREAAAKLLEPKAVKVTPPSATLKETGEVDTYLADLRAEIMRHVEAGRPVII